MDNIFLEELFYLVTLPLLPIIIHYFYSHCFVSRLTTKANLVIVYSLYFLCIVFLHYSSLPGSILLTLNIGLIALLSFFYNGNIKWRIVAALFLVALITLSELSLPLFYSTKGYILNQFLSKLLMFILAFVSVRVAKAFGNGGLSKWYWVLLFICPSISTLGIYSFASSLYMQSFPTLVPILSTGLLIINLLIFILCDRMLVIQSAQNQSYLLEQQNAYYVNQYLLTKEIQEESFKFQHDIKNILIGLRAKVQSGEAANLNELDNLLGQIDNPIGVSNSGNTIIDSIINYKQQVAEKHQIPFKLDMNIPAQLTLDTTIISVILGNALDNAIEACCDRRNEECYITIHMHYLNESLFIRIQNPYVNEIHTNRFGDICSTKTNKSGHGIGLKSIQKVVEDSNGLVDISYNNNLFQVEIVLFMVACKKRNSLS
ncbi:MULTISPECIES: GHKL domain-containing protein [Paenibacillus]|uniref:GHKL domain-containing protein n=1 Tax=Paenibacillus TaxID=44249 RepID=UPI002DB7F6B8|nr:GHKL domain-containing protein [Paenibacillus odorifer]MEC0135069.1 GHKL domain-containing protein [Paenibacillus odorifer]MEC0219643.1 GHKL domain-containing protein [Paenibacillus odorifer]